MDLSGLSFKQQIEYISFKSYAVNVNVSIESWMHEIKRVVTEHHGFNVWDYSILKIHFAAFGMSVFWRKVLKNWWFNRKLLHKFIFFDWGFEERSLAGIFEEDELEWRDVSELKEFWQVLVNEEAKSNVTDKFH